MSDVSLASLRRARSALTVGDVVNKIGAAFTRNPVIYWSDLLASCCIGWFLFAVSARQPMGSVLHLTATLGAIFALLRAAMFVHELAHLEPNQLRGFGVAWNFIIGIPLLIPSLTYVDSHLDHHRNEIFGTQGDPEYALISRWSRLRIVAFVFTVLLMPVVLPLRWGFFGPLSRLIPSLRSLVVGKFSSLVINADYVRSAPSAEQTRRWNIEEAATALLVWAVVAATSVEWIPLGWVIQWCVVVGGILAVNQVRMLVAHGYENEGEPMNAEDQLLDSVSLRGWRIFTVLFAPIGMRFLALHHYRPSLPYHSLGRVHRALLDELPQCAPYRATVRDGMGSLRNLWRNAAA